MLSEERKNALLSEVESEIGYVFPENTRFISASGNLKIEKKDGDFAVYYSSAAQLPRAALLMKAHGGDVDFSIEDECSLKELCFMVDCSRNGVLSVESVKKYVRNLSMLGYKSMMLYTEDTYEIDGEPIFGYLRGGYTKAEMKEIDAYAKDWGIEMIPCIQTLAHLNALRRYYADYEDLFDDDDILLADDERVYALIDKMFKTTSECFSSRRLHIGMDEAHNVGRGRYMDKHGYRPSFDILSEHLKRVAEIAKKYGYTVMAWSDMFLNIANRDRRRLDENGEPLIPQDVIDELPDNVSVCHWDYSAFPSQNYYHRFKMHDGFKNPVWFALSAKKALGFLPGNTHSEHEVKTAFAALRKYGINRVINCSWNDDGAEASQFSCLSEIANVAGYAYGKTRAQMKKEFFALTGYTYAAFEKLEWADNACGKITEDGVRVTKVMLYNDLLTGQLDTEVDKNYTLNFTRAANALTKVAKGRYAYMFKNAAALSRVLEVKYELGANLRAAYAAGDKPRMFELTKVMDETVRRIKKFIVTLREQWMKEFKPYGFEIEEYRLGGLIERIRGCKERVLKYLGGEVQNIPELEETLYPDAWIGRNERTGRQGYNRFSYIASVNAF